MIYGVDASDNLLGEHLRQRVRKNLSKYRAKCALPYPTMPKIQIRLHRLRKYLSRVIQKGVGVEVRLRYTSSINLQSFRIDSH